MSEPVPNTPESIVPLPCPFCGGEPEISESDNGEPRWVWCPGCEADGPPIDYRFKGSKEEARRIVVDAWNRRKGREEAEKYMALMKSLGSISPVHPPIWDSRNTGQ